MSDQISQALPTPMPGDITAEMPSPSGFPAPDRAPPLLTRQLKRPRVWPGIVAILLQWLLIVVPGLVMPQSMETFQLMMLGAAVGVVGVLLWWLGFSRVPFLDRVLGVLACAGIGVGSVALFHPTMGSFSDPNGLFMTLVMFALPWITTAWVVWMTLTPFLSWSARRAGLVVVLLLAWGYLDLLRFDGVWGGMYMERSWRWTPDHEAKFQAYQAAHKGTAPVKALPDATALKLRQGDWPGFRGAERDGRLNGVCVAADWKKNPPRQLWRMPVGPSWSSFAVIGDLLYTQDQDDKNERVVCYNAATGDLVWQHLDVDVRFTEKVAGPGPRATPTFHEGMIYALGASGQLNCLNAATGKVEWSKDVRKDSKAKVPVWGYASSPLVARGVVIVFVGDPEDKSVRGYNAKTGDLLWSAGKGKLSYCSAHLARLDGVEQVLMTSDKGLTSFDPTDGKVLWDYVWDAGEVARIVQPAILNDTDVLVGTGFSFGTQRLRVKKVNGAWTQEVLWTSKAIKPYFNDMVVYKDHLYGFDTGMLTCVSLEDGKGGWRARGYENGQALLLADQGLLLVLSERGLVALVEANPEKYKEVGRFQAIEGKTWNHPVVAHGKLFVRNGEEAACYQLTEETAKPVAAK